MELGLIFTLSCVMTTIAMIIFLGVLVIFARYGTQGVQVLFDRFTGGGDEQNQQTDNQGQPNQQPAVASSQSLRQRARGLDFPAPAGTAGATAFGAQSASSGIGNNYPDFPPPQNTGFQAQASLRPSGQTSSFNAQPAQPSGQTGGFQPSTPSLSPSRPFSQGSERFPNQSQQNFGQQGQGGFGQAQQPLQGGFNAQSQGQQGNFGQQPPQQGGFGQPQQPLQGGFNAQGQGQQGGFGQQPPQQGGFGQPQQPLQGGFNAQGQGQQGGFGQQPPQQGNFGQQPPQQGGFNAQGQQGNFGQQPPPPPQQGGLGQNRPPLRSRPRPGNTQYDRPIGGRDRRQGDDRDFIYDDQGNRVNNSGFVDDVGDFIDNF